ncbi:unnamed protein product [Polarella glacialis]|uniref:Transmembrane protein n=1 Tax=Polarella glacialis TaxID=89957 RepID=A0A813IZW1_POLGL|nr:unnamed protein product [Polarella glacialis]|mmetsp:Transcript_11579/g.20874  ORF Transcript_11579/g.20874 Transcript_11579/m.20874 type:complete len:136 (+) Transcript_11579:43-450(+)
MASAAYHAGMAAAQDAASRMWTFGVEGALLDQMAVFVVVSTVLIMISKPIHPKVTWGMPCIAQMALHMWSLVIVAAVLFFNEGEDPLCWKMALASFFGAMAMVTNLITLHIDLDVMVTGVVACWECLYVANRFGK